MLIVGRHNKEIRCIICWHDEKSRSKEHDALCHWKEYIKKKAVALYWRSGWASYEEEKVTFVKDLQTYAMHLFASIWKCLFLFWCTMYFIKKDSINPVMAAFY